MILGSAVCGSQAFADAFRREIALVLPDAPLRSLPPGHAAGIDGQLVAFDVSSVAIRTPAGGGKAITRRLGSPTVGSGDGRQCRGSLLFSA